MSAQRCIYSTLHTTSVSKFLAENYALGTGINCQLLSRGFNDNYLVRTETGGKFVFRISQHRDRGPADVATETAFLQHLHRAGVPVAVPVRTRSQELHVLVHAHEGMREGVLFHALDGRTPDARSATDARANGVSLAKVHEAAASFVPRAPRYALDLDHLVWRPLERLRTSGLVEDDFAQFHAVAERTVERIARSHLTRVQCHGDCHGQNAKISDDGQAILFDFDDGGPGFLAYDLAVFLWAKAAFGRRLHPLWHAFIDGYRSVRPIKSADFEAVRVFVLVRHIWVMGEYASRSQEWGSEQLAWMSHEIDFLRSWEDDHLCGQLL